MNLKPGLMPESRWILIGVMLLSCLTNWAIGQNSQPTAQGTDPKTLAGDQQDVDPGSIDKLLDMVDKDISQLPQVSVAGHTGSAMLDTPVSTVERQASTVGKTPAAVFVITNEMIRRSGAVCIPDVLRMVPGIQVAQTSSDEWAISARGFNAQYSNKLLVQIDGRTVYDLCFGGVFWDVQDLILEDVERIEVVRGPGATIWGSNAVNGVINIITKKAQDTQGVLVQGGAGNHERGYTNARVGGCIGQDMAYRVYGKWFDRGPSYLPDGGTAPDEWHQGRSGFRMDYDASRSDAMTLQGDYYDGNTVTLAPNQIPTAPFSVASNQGHVTGENILYRWKHTIDQDVDWTFQTYYDRAQRHLLDPGYGLDDEVFDLDFQHRFPLGSRNAFIWGCGYRFYQDAFQITQPASPFYYITVDPPDRFVNYFSYFLQDQITLVEDRLFFIAGSKFEHNNYTNFEYQPTVRLLWTPTERHSFWGAVSRAVHVPTRETSDATITMPSMTPPPFTPPVIFPQVDGNPGLLSEELLAYECGMRVQATERFSWDLALFYNQYDRLNTLAPNGYDINMPFIFMQAQFQNGASAETYGAELAANYTVNDHWRLQCSYTYIELFVHDSTGTVGNAANPGATPNNQLYLQSSWDLGTHWQFDLTGRYVDALLTDLPPQTPSYFVMDTRLAWHRDKNLEVALMGRNLGRGYYSEFAPATSQVAYKVGPEVYGQITLRY
jgi:iron complex outermembrane recepter protein